MALHVKGTRLMIALDGQPGKMFGILKVREIRMKIATYGKNLFKTFIKTFYFLPLSPLKLTTEIPCTRV